MTETPRALSASIWRKRIATSRSVIAEVGSSMMMIFADVEIALTISTSCISATLRDRIERGGRS